MFYMNNIGSMSNCASISFFLFRFRHVIYLQTFGETLKHEEPFPIFVLKFLENQIFPPFPKLPPAAY